MHLLLKILVQLSALSLPSKLVDKCLSGKIESSIKFLFGHFLGHFNTKTRSDAVSLPNWALRVTKMENVVHEIHVNQISKIQLYQPWIS